MKVHEECELSVQSPICLCTLCRLVPHGKRHISQPRHTDSRYHDEGEQNRTQDDDFLVSGRGSKPMICCVCFLKATLARGKAWQHLLTAMFHCPAEHPPTASNTLHKAATYETNWSQASAEYRRSHRRTLAAPSSSASFPIRLLPEVLQFFTTTIEGLRAHCKLFVSLSKARNV